MKVTMHAHYIQRLNNSAEKKSLIYRSIIHFSRNEVHIRGKQRKVDSECVFRNIKTQTRGIFVRFYVVDICADVFSTSIQSQLTTHCPLCKICIFYF